MTSSACTTGAAEARSEHSGALCALEQNTASQEVCTLYPTLPGPGLPLGKSLLLLLLGTEQHCYKSHLPQDRIKYRDELCENLRGGRKSQVLVSTLMRRDKTQLLTITHN